MRVERLGARTGTFVLGGISFTVQPTHWAAVIGPSGAGKTTLLECLAGLVAADAGTIHFAGREMTRLPPEEREVALAYQHAFLFPHLDVGGNVGYGARDRATAHEVARRLNIESLWPRDVRTLSGGERQLVSLGRALARASPLLLLDEPFSSLDYSRRSDVRAIVRELARERGTTVVLVTHDLHEAAQVASVVVHLRQGRMAAVGSPTELVTPLLST